jgi:hypothetical protein
MVGPAFKVWRILEEREVGDDQNGKYLLITKKEFVGEIVDPREEIFVTWPELVEQYGEGYYLVEIPKEFLKHYVLPAEQHVRTPGAF